MASAPRAMASSGLQPTRWSLVCTLLSVAALAAPTVALGAPKRDRDRPAAAAVGALVQLKGSRGCLVDRSKPRPGCRSVRALAGPAPFLGSDAIAISGDGRHVYVASSRSDAIAIFRRNRRTGRLAQRSGTAGCIAARGAGGCAKARGLDGPNSIAISGDGRSVYATSRISDAITTFRRNRATGALRQLRGAAGCIADRPIRGCARGRALDGADVVKLSPDGANVYVGALLGNAVAAFARNPSRGALTQLPGTTGCIAVGTAGGCTTGLALAAPEGLAVSADGGNVYVASAVANAVVALTRDPSTGALTQPSDGSGCIDEGQLTGCTPGRQLAGANAVAVGPGDADVYVTSLLSNSVASFTRTPATGQLTQKAGTSACVVYVLAVGCSLGRALRAPAGIAVSPDGATVYAAAFRSGAIAVLDRDDSSGALMQKRRRRGCASTRRALGCARGRGLLGVSSLAVSPDGRFLYSAAFKSDAVGVFKRVAASRPRGKG